MAINDSLLNNMQAEKADLIKKLDKNPHSEDLKRLLKNINERIRVRSKKLTTGESTPEPVKSKTVKARTGSIKEQVISAVQAGMTDHQKIADKFGFKPESVRWYLTKLKLVK